MGDEIGVVESLGKHLQGEERGGDKLLNGEGVFGALICGFGLSTQKVFVASPYSNGHDIYDIIKRGARSLSKVEPMSHLILS